MIFLKKPHQTIPDLELFFIPKKKSQPPIRKIACKNTADHLKTASLVEKAIHFPYRILMIIKLYS